MKNILLTLALGSGLLLIACSGAATIPEANKNTAKPAAAPAANAPAKADEAKAEAPATDSDTLTNKEAGVQFSVPKGWKNSEEDGALTVTSPDDGVAVSIVVSPAENLEKAINAATTEMDKFIKNAKIEKKAEEGTVNGLKTVSMYGTGEIEGKPANWDLTIVEAKKPLLVISVGTPESIEKHGKDYEKMVNSIKPL